MPGQTYAACICQAPLIGSLFPLRCTPNSVHSACDNVLISKRNYYKRTTGNIDWMMRWKPGDTFAGAPFRPCVFKMSFFSRPLGLPSSLLSDTVNSRKTAVWNDDKNFEYCAKNFRHHPERFNVRRSFVSHHYLKHRTDLSKCVETDCEILDSQFPSR